MAWHIKCYKCGEVNKVATSKRQNDARNGQGPFHVNTKLGFALPHAGVGDTTVAKICGILNIPCIASKNLKKQERKAGGAIKKIAQRSCDDALSFKAELPSDGLHLTYDAGWQKRGSVRNYSSSSGHDSVFGCRTKKIVGYKVMNKHCKMCTAAAKKGKLVPKHDCRKNWCGSSKAMEPAIAVSILKNIQQKG